jgi:hypothetical protein
MLSIHFRMPSPQRHETRDQNRIMCRPNLLTRWHVNASVQAKSETRHKTYSNLPEFDHLSEGTALAWNLFTANISATSDCQLATSSSSTISRSTLPDSITVHCL